MTRLLEDVLDVSHIARSKLVLRRDGLDPATAIERAIEIARPWIDEGGQSFELTWPPESMPVNGDLARLAQVISNLHLVKPLELDDLDPLLRRIASRATTR